MGVALLPHDPAVSPGEVLDNVLRVTHQITPVGFRVNPLDDGD